MERPISTLLSPPHASEVFVLERVLLRLGEFNALNIGRTTAVGDAVAGRGLIAAVSSILRAAHQARGEEHPVRPLDLYAALYGISFEDSPPWATSNRALHLALRLDAQLERGKSACLGDWLALPLALTPALPPADAALGAPRLFRALELLRLSVLQSRRQVECWGALPFALSDVGLTHLPVPGLTLTHQRLRFERFDAIVVRRALLEQLDQMLFELIALTRRLNDNQTVMKLWLAGLAKPAGLGRLADLLLKLPLVSPALLTRMLKIDISAAGRLCARAADIGLLQLISSRGSWKVYAATKVQDRYGVKLETPTLSSPGIFVSPELEKLFGGVDALLAELDGKIA
jgi:hypothetical protein